MATDVQTAPADADGRIGECLRLVFDLARLKFDQRAVVSPVGDAIDALAAGLNMLGEELQASTVTIAQLEQLIAERIQILEQKNRELALFRALVDQFNDAVQVVDPSTGRFIDVNERACRDLGYTREEYLDLSVTDVDPNSSASTFVDVVEHVHQGLLRTTESIHRRKDGSTFPVEISLQYVHLERGYIIAVARDISQRKDDMAARLLLSTAIEQADECVIITDPQGNIVYANPTFEALMGYSQAEAVGRNPRFLKSGVQDEAFYRTLWQTITSGKVWRGRLVNRRKDGTLCTMDGTISPVRNADGIITNYVAVRRDVTVIVALEAQFRHAQKMEAVGRLAGGVAHDFNNILSVILSYAEMVGGDLKPDEPARADIEEIRKAALRATDLTRQLLAFSRQQVLEAKVLNLSQSVAGLEKMLRRLLGADVELVMLSPTGLGNVKADPGQVEQILMNLAVNARDAMPQGGKLTIETANVELDDDYARAHANARAGAYVMLAVSDTGTGMDAETQARIFEPFFTTKEKGKGTGLGLATVFGIVAQSNGHILVYSEPGKGTTFKIYFPRTSGAAVVDSSQPPAPEPGRGSETILLVDDDDQVRAVARAILRRNGYVVLEASSGGEAFLICEQHEAKIHLLLTDVIMPRMSGRQLADRLAKLRPQMKVLFMSGYTDDTVLQHGILESGVAFLQKPLTPTSLTSKVRQVLRSGGTG
jgi:two-component system cell cycle sensor histidine kinase/response regulator CckA